MSETLKRVRELVGRREVCVSDHGYDELANDSIFIQDILAGVLDGIVIEDYPDYYKGPSVWSCSEMNKALYTLFGELVRTPHRQPS
jgi:hypothetical protein